MNVQPEQRKKAVQAISVSNSYTYLVVTMVAVLSICSYKVLGTSIPSESNNPSDPSKIEITQVAGETVHTHSGVQELTKPVIPYMVTRVDQDGNQQQQHQRVWSNGPIGIAPDDRVIRLDITMNGIKHQVWVIVQPADTNLPTNNN